MRKVLILLLATSFIGIVAAMVVLKYARPYSGDGNLIDHGFWSSPRYRVEFEPFDLNTTLSKTYVVKNLPATKMTFGLELNDSRENDVLSSNSNSIKVSINVEDLLRRTNYSLQLPVGDWIRHKSDRITLWHPDLRDLRFSRKEYRLVVDVEVDRERQLGPVIVTPVIEGGGNELP